MSLIEIISACAHHLQVECIQRFGVLNVAYNEQSRRMFKGPALVQTGRIGELNLTSIPEELYGTTQSPESVIDGWDRMAPFFLKGQGYDDVKAIVSEKFPRMPLIEDSMRDTMVQYLRAGAWSGLKLELGPNKVLLHYPSLYTIGFDGNWILLSTGARSRRLTKLGPVTHRALRSHLGRPKTSTMQVGALHDFLVARLPEQAHTVATLCATTVWAGRDAELALAVPFDLERVEDGEGPRVSIWARARAVAQNPASNPLPELWLLLRSRFTAREFTKEFGNPHRKRKTMYDQARDRLVRKIDEYERREGGRIDKDPAAEASELLQLQQIIGRV